MPKMIVLKAKGLRYAKRHYAQGEVLDVKEGHVTPLTITRIAEVMNAQASKDEAAAKAKTSAPRPANKDKTAKAKASEKNLTEMTIPELRRTAKAMGVAVKGGARKSDIIDLLRMQRYGRRDMRATD